MQLCTKFLRSCQGFYGLRLYEILNLVIGLHGSMNVSFHFTTFVVMPRGTCIHKKSIISPYISL